MYHSLTSNVCYQSTTKLTGWKFGSCTSVGFCTKNTIYGEVAYTWGGSCVSMVTSTSSSVYAAYEASLKR